MDENSNRLVDAGAFPKVILLDTLSYCNLRCPLCGYRLMTRKKGRMSWDLYTRLIDEIAEKRKDARVWMVFVGEALITWRSLVMQVAYAKQKGLTDVVLNSNGTLLSDECCTGLVESGLDAIYTGIDAFKPETYKKLRAGGDYDRVVANVLRLAETKRRMLVPATSAPQVFVQFVETAENTDEVEAFRRYWMGEGVGVKIRPQATWAGTIEPWRATRTERYPCYWAMQGFVVCWDGRVALCAADYDAKFVAGDVSKDSIQSVWMNSLKGIRDTHRVGRYDELPEFCRSCTDWQMARAEYYNK